MSNHKEDNEELSNMLRAHANWRCFCGKNFGSVLFAASVVLISGAVAWSQVPPPISDKIEINATPKAIFEAIRIERNSEKFHSHLISFKDKIAISKEVREFPVLGKVDCTWQDNETPYSKVVSKLLHSNKYKSGLCTLLICPSANGKSFTLAKTVDIDIGIPVPEKSRAAGMHRDIQYYLADVKDVAERLSSTKKP